MGITTHPVQQGEKTMNTAFNIKNDPESLVFNNHDVFWTVNLNITRSHHGPNWFGRRKIVNLMDSL
jgi:hypothetical protein